MTAATAVEAAATAAAHAAAVETAARRSAALPGERWKQRSASLLYPSTWTCIIVVVTSSKFRQLRSVPIMERGFRTFFSLLPLCIGFSNYVVAQKVTASQGWPTYGGDPGGQRYSAAKQITRANVQKLHVVWTYHTKALESGQPAVSRSDFEATPILVDDALYLSTPFDRVISLNPATGAENWTYDPHLPPTIQAPNYTSRGVASWRDSSSKRAVGDCLSRIFIATLDARLIALDASTGRPCNAFGDGGTVDLRVGIATRAIQPYLAYGNTSPATVVGDVVVVGSAVADNRFVNIESGAVRGFDVRTGKLLWTWEPIPWAAHQKMHS
jgi:quinoprotein glucose dehydrogenase